MRDCVCVSVRVRAPECAACFCRWAPGSGGVGVFGVFLWRRVHPGGGVCTRRAADHGSACAWLCIYVDTRAKGRVSVCVNCTGVSGKEGGRY